MIAIRKTMILSAVLAIALGVLWASPVLAWPEEGRAALVPTQVEVAPGSAQQFRAIQLARRLQVAQPAADVTWRVDGVEGGNATLGTIDSAGLYRAPATPPAEGAVHITAEVPAAINRVMVATVVLSNTPGYRSDGQWPVEQIEASGLLQPRRIAFSSTGHIFVLDTLSGKIAQFDKDGTYVEDFGRNEEGKPAGGFCMMAVAPSGQVYSGDLATGPPRINAYNPKGDWLLGFGQKGSRPGMVVEPTGMAFHPDGRIYLSDMDAMRVTVFDENHQFVRYLRESAPEGNRTNAPSDVAMDPAGDLFIASVYGPCEKVSADTGERLFAFAYPLPPDGMMYIDDLCLDRWGNVYLAVRSGADPVESGPDHGGTASIMKYTNTGDFLTEIKLSVEDPKRVSVAVDDDGKVYAAYSTRILNPEVPRDPDDKTVTAGVEVFVKE